MGVDVGQVDIELSLPPDQVRFLHWLRGVEGDKTLSAAFSEALERALESMPQLPAQPTKKQRVHLSISTVHLTKLEQVARQSGLMRSEVALRVIEHVAARGMGPLAPD